MENPQTQQFLDHLASHGRVKILGGAAVIAHGLPRNTKDADIWLEPMPSSAQWSAKVNTVMRAFPICRHSQLFPPAPLALDDLESTIARDGVFRVTGLEKPLGIFRVPNGLAMDEFAAVWKRALPFADGVRLMSESDLIQTKTNTGRERDLRDIGFLADRLQQRYVIELKNCDLLRAKEIFKEIMDIPLFEAALDNSDSEVRALSKTHLQQFAQEGDPYAQDAWQKHFPTEPYSP